MANTRAFKPAKTQKSISKVKVNLMDRGRLDGDP